MRIGIKGFENCVWCSVYHFYKLLPKTLNIKILIPYTSTCLQETVLCLIFKYHLGRIEEQNDSQAEQIESSYPCWNDQHSAWVCVFLKLALVYLKTMLKALQNMKKQTISAINGRDFQFKFYLIILKPQLKIKSSRTMALGFF